MPVGRRVVKSVRRALWHSSTGKRPRKPGKHGLAHRNADLFTRPHARSGERRVCPRFPADIVVFCKRLVLSASGMGLGAESIASGPAQAFVWRDVPLVQRRQPKTSTVPARLGMMLLRQDCGHRAHRQPHRHRHTGWYRVPGEEKVFLRPSWSEATRGRKKACPHAARGLVLVR